MTYFINQKLLRLRGTSSLAEIADGAGIARGFLSDLESGKKAASQKTIEKLAEYFGIPASELTNSVDDTPLSNAVRHVKVDSFQRLLELYAEDIKSDFQSSCLYKDAWVHPSFIDLLKNMNYSVGMETTEREETKRFTDKHEGYYFNSSWQLNSVSLTKGRYRLNLQLDDLLDIQQSVTEYIMFLLYRHAEYNNKRTRVKDTTGQKK